MVTIDIEAKLKMRQSDADQCLNYYKLEKKYPKGIPSSVLEKALKKCMRKELKGSKIQVRSGIYQLVTHGKITKVKKIK